MMPQCWLGALFLFTADILPEIFGVYPHEIVMEVIGLISFDETALLKSDVACGDLLLS